MKAQRVAGLEGEMPLSEAARRIVAVRAAELYAFVPEALGENASSAMHDMRIAAKRLRYLLELVGFCFGDVGEEARLRARELQDVLGEIHDCDVMLARIAASRGALCRAPGERVRPLSRAVGADRVKRPARPPPHDHVLFTGSRDRGRIIHGCDERN